MAMRLSFAAAALIATLACPAQAQDETGADRAAIRKVERAVLPQEWYPEGYYDVRIAAEIQAAEALRGRAVLIGDCPGGGGQCYSLVNPIPQRINPGESDPALRRYGNIALEISRLRQEFELIGYGKPIYAEPLATYERQLIDAAEAPQPPPGTFEGAALDQLAAAAEASRSKQAAGLPRIISGKDALPTQVVVIRATGPSAATYPPGKRIKSSEKLVLRTGDRLVLLDSRGTRTLTGPGVFTAASLATSSTAPKFMTDRIIAPGQRVGAVRGGRPPGSSVIVSTSPPGGEVLLVSAFAFKLCARKQADSWNRFACKWNEIETGTEQDLAGRYVYQVKWPDGVVRKGTREIVPDYDGDGAVAVTFKKVGS